VTVQQLGDALKQVQEAVTRGICEQMKVPDPPQKTPVDIIPSRSVATPYASREQAAAWYMEQEESSHPPHIERNPTEKQNLTRVRLTGKEQTGGRRPPNQHGFSEKVGPEGNPRQGNTFIHPVEPSFLEDGLIHPTALKVGNSIERGSCPTFVTPFSREILEAPRLSKVKMPSVDLFDGTTYPDDHVDVYKAQIYVQDVDDATCCRYFPATLKGIAQKWFNGLPRGSVSSFSQLAELFSAHFVASKKERKTSIHLARIRQQRGEDLKGYVRRFNHEAVLIPDL